MNLHDMLLSSKLRGDNGSGGGDTAGAAIIDVVELPTVLISTSKVHST